MPRPESDPEDPTLSGNEPTVFDPDGVDDTVAVRPSPVFPDSDIGPGLQLGRYRIREELGRGGQGIVFLAQDEDLDRPVALKVLTRGGSLSPRARRRFEREAAIASRLDHPGICTVYEVGEAEGYPFIAMQYVRGETLDRNLHRCRAEGASPPLDLPSRDNESHSSSGSASRASSNEPYDLVAAFFEDAARSLHVAHEAGLVHRDVKPANLMRTETGGAVVLDFGLARDADRPDDDAAGITLSGEIMGTPAFMSPEQITGEQERIDCRTDVYALGVSLYEALTFERPFRAPTFEGLARAIRLESPRLPSSVAPRVPRDLEVIVMTAIDRDPERRYASALDLAEDLRRFRRREPILARPAGRVLRVRRWAQRNPALATLVAATLVAVLAAGTILFVKNRELAALNVDLERAGKRARLEASRADEKAREVERSLSALLVETRAKEAALADYGRMADVRRLRDARRELAAMWPVAPALVPRLDAWSTRYAPLFERLPEHRDALTRLRARGNKIEGETPETEPSWDFGERAELAFQHEVLSRLIVDLEDFADAESGARVEVAQRRVDALRIAEATVEDPAEAWRDAATRVRDDARFAGFELKPQLGLIPLGPNVATGLEEFLDWRTQGRDPETGAFEPLVRNEKGRLALSADRGLIFVLVPPGETLVGAQAKDPGGDRYDPAATPTEGPVRRFVLESPLLVGKLEFTQAQWKRVTGANPSYYRIGFRGRDMKRPVSGMHPVERVSQDQASEVLARLGLRLASQEEWEYFARAGGAGIFPPAKERSGLGRYANLAGREVARHFQGADRAVEDRHILHAPTGSYLGNRFGLHDTLGNIWEWTATRGSDNLGVACGGSFYGGSNLARISLGFRFARDARHDYLGLRAVRDLD